MRLIDADKLQDDGANYFYDQFANHSFFKKEVRFVDREQINNAPTVKAIPVEWIQTYARRYIDAEKLFPISCKGEGDFGYAIKLMVEEWEYELGEKENE